MTNIPGIGNMACWIHFEFDRFNINDAYTSNKYDDGGVRWRCENNRRFGAIFTDKDADLFDDNFDIDGEVIPTGYRFTVHIKSEVNIPLWNDGIIEFLYNTKTGHWTMRGSADETEWAFCRPDKALYLVLAGLKCMLDAGNERFGGEAYISQIELIYEALKKDHEQIIKNPALHADHPGCLKE